jgi:3',5'-cyclic-AMP phosphodiesterase
MKLIHLTDTHLVAPGERLYGLDPQARLDACIDDINRQHADAELVVITGDLTHFGDPAAFACLRTSLARLRPPVRLLPGNHDTRDVFRATFPQAPFDTRCEALQSVLDNEQGRFLFLDTTQAGTHAGWFDEARQDWLVDRLREVDGRPVFLFMHHPPFPVGLPAMDAIGLVQADALSSRLTPWLPQIRHIFFGHVHRPISGSWRGVPFSTLRATNHQVALDFHSADAVPGSHEPPAYAVVLIRADQVLVHTHDFLDVSPRFSLSDVDYGFWDEQGRRLQAGV